MIHPVLDAIASGLLAGEPGARRALDTLDLVLDPDDVRAHWHAVDAADASVRHVWARALCRLAGAGALHATHGIGLYALHAASRWNALRVSGCTLAVRALEVGEPPTAPRTTRDLKAVLSALEAPARRPRASLPEACVARLRGDEVHRARLAFGDRLLEDPRVARVWWQVGEGEPVVIATLEEALLHARGPVRAYVAAAVWALTHDDEALATVIGGLKHDEATVRAAAVDAARCVTTPTTARIADILLDDPAVAVRINAMYTLHTLYALRSSDFEGRPFTELVRYVAMPAAGRSSEAVAAMRAVIAAAGTAG